MISHRLPAWKHLMLLAAVLACPAPAGATASFDCTLVMGVGSVGPVSGILWTLDYSKADGEIVGTGSSAACTKLISDSLFVEMDVDATKKLQIGVVPVPAFQTPTDLASCAFQGSRFPSSGDFTVTTDDASDADNASILPKPQVVVSSITCNGETTTTTTTTTLPRSCQDWTATFTLDSASTTLGGILFDVDYSQAGGVFPGNGAEVACSSLVAGADFAPQDEPADSTLSLGLITLGGIGVGTDLVACTFRSTAGEQPVADDFAMEVMDASDLDVEPADAAVTIRLESVGGVIPCGSECGDGYVDSDEECDDGNGVNTDACTNTCKAASCGDGVLQAGVEDCDDGNAVDGDSCLNTCKSAACGDGVVRSGVEQCDDGNKSNTDDCLNNCHSALCGDGAVRAGVEQCDDHNSSNIDSCLNDCTTASCGDGFVHTGVETCDDANTADSDNCPSTCKIAKCGDGFVHAGAEACDDGNTSNTDECVKGCQQAFCGDGYVLDGVEECDNGTKLGTGGCSLHCKAGPLCADANGDHKVSAADALRVMQRAVSLDVDCPDWTCDANDDDEVSVSDALVVLRKAVRLPVTLSCREPGWLVLRMTTPAPLGGLQVTVDYPAADATLSGTGAAVDCEGLIPGAVFAFNQGPGSTLSMSMASVDGVAAPRNIARCVLLPSGPVRPDDFEVTVDEAVSPSVQAVPGVQVKAIPY